MEERGIHMCVYIYKMNIYKMYMCVYVHIHRYRYIYRSMDIMQLFLGTDKPKMSNYDTCN